MLTKFIFISTALLLLVLIIKTILFFILRSRRWTFGDFLFFNHFHFYVTDDPRRETYKRLLNALTILICLLFFVIALGLIFLII